MPTAKAIPIADYNAATTINYADGDPIPNTIAAGEYVLVRTDENTVTIDAVAAGSISPTSSVTAGDTLTYTPGNESADAGIEWHLDSVGQDETGTTVVTDSAGDWTVVVSDGTRGSDTTTAVTVASAGGAPTTIALDNFTAANGTALIGRTADTGGTWSVALDNGAIGTPEIQSNALDLPQSGNDSYYKLSTPSAADVTVTADLTWTAGDVAGGDYVGVLARVTGTNGTFACYYVRMSIQDDVAQLYYFSGGSATQIGANSAALNTSIPGTGTLVLRCIGTSIEVDWEGTTVLSATDSNVTGAGSVGIGQFRGDNLRVDTFEATT